ncbi:MAG: dephospho-CoA kinase [Acidobacteria bacterium]|nr:dephospho-CoA kinase [Acidobacteriota bacterium]
MAAERLCVGLTGRMASGKGEAVRFLQRRGFTYISLSDIVRREAARGGETVSRGAMQDIGNRLRAEGGAGVLGRMVRERVLAAAERRWVIDGIRNPAEVAELRKMSGFFLVAIDCGVETILARMKQRGRAGDAAPEAELRAALEREWGGSEPAAGQQVGPTMALADFTVANDGTLAGLQAQLDEVLKKIGAEHE